MRRDKADCSRRPLPLPCMLASNQTEVPDVDSILELLRKSPFGPLARHTEQVHDAVTLIRPLVEAFTAGDWDRTAEVSERIGELEHQADLIKNDIRDNLPKSVFLPVDRSDVLRFLRIQDRIADSAEDVGVLLTMRHTPTPQGMQQGVLALVGSVIDTGDAWFNAAQELFSLQQASFTGSKVEKVILLINEVREREREADRHQAAVTQQLFGHEPEIGPLSIMLWMNIFRALGMVANYAESTADQLRLMLARQ